MARLTFGLQLTITIVVLAALTGLGWWIGASIIYARQEQPIKFPHDLHAGNRQIACQYCHRGVHNGTIAGVPSVQECMDCHQVVATDRPEVKKLRDDYWKGKANIPAAGQSPVPIPWFKIYRLPDHVKFSHQIHINQGFDCSECHGNVREMRVMDVAPGKNPIMGFCLDCHLAKRGPTNCSACHY
jgi:hypothetical protein